MSSGDTLGIFTPHQHEPNIVSLATLDVRGLSDHPVIDFGDAANGIIFFHGIMPNNYEDNGCSVDIHYAMSADISDVVRWEVAFERLNEEDPDLDDNNFAANQGTSDTCPANLGDVGVASISFTHAQMDSIVAGELYRIALYRVGAHGDDTASGDAEFLALEMREA